MLAGRSRSERGLDDYVNKKISRLKRIFRFSTSSKISSGDNVEDGKEGDENPLRGCKSLKVVYFQRLFYSENKKKYKNNMSSNMFFVKLTNIK